MAQMGIVNAKSIAKLPSIARQLIEKNRQRRTGDKNSENFRGRLNKTVSYLRWKAACASLSDAIGYGLGIRARTILRALSQNFPEGVESLAREFPTDGL